MSNKEKITICLTYEDRIKLKVIAEAEEKTESEVIREFIRGTFEKQCNKHPMYFWDLYIEFKNEDIQKKKEKKNTATKPFQKPSQETIKEFEEIDLEKIEYNTKSLLEEVKIMIEGHGNQRQKNTFNKLTNIKVSDPQAIETQLQKIELRGYSRNGIDTLLGMLKN